MKKACELNVFRLALACATTAKHSEHYQDHDADKDNDYPYLERRDKEGDERNQLFQERDDQKKYR